MNFHNKNIPSIYFFGHFAIDTIIRFKKENKPSLGGSVTFGPLSLRKYTKDVKISIISNLGSLNFDKSLLDLMHNKDIDLKGLKWNNSKNTNFVLDYFNHSRTLTLKSKSPNLEFKDIPLEYINNPPNIIVLAPLCNEISHDYILEIMKYFPNAYIGIDLQGFIRKIDNGVVKIIRDNNIIDNMEKIINSIGEKLILKGSEEEVKILSGKDDVFEAINYFSYFRFNGIFIMTLGEGGSLILKRGEKILKIPAFKAREVVDETGAGDVYFAIFLYELAISDMTWVSVEKAGYLASSAASFNVEKTGPHGFETKENVLERLNAKNYIES